MKKKEVQQLIQKWLGHAATYERCEKIHLTEDNPENEDLCRTAKLILRNCASDLEELL